MIEEKYLKAIPKANKSPCPTASDLKKNMDVFPDMKKTEIGKTRFVNKCWD